MTFIQLEVVETFEVEHEITFKNIDKFQYNMERFLIQSGKYMILDLTKVMYLNNSALGIIARSAMNAKKYNKELVIIGNKPPLSEIFDIVKFNTFIKLFTTREEALQYFRHK